MVDIASEIRGDPSALTEDDQILLAICKVQLRNVIGQSGMRVIVVRDQYQQLGDPSPELLAALKQLGDARPNSTVDRRQKPPAGTLLLDNGPIKLPAPDRALVAGCCSSPGGPMREYEYEVKCEAGVWTVTSERVTLMV